MTVELFIAIAVAAAIVLAILLDHRAPRRHARARAQRAPRTRRRPSPRTRSATTPTASSARTSGRPCETASRPAPESRAPPDLAAA